MPWHPRDGRWIEEPLGERFPVRLGRDVDMIPAERRGDDGERAEPEDGGDGGGLAAELFVPGRVPRNVIDVRAAGATGNGRDDDTEAVQGAIDRAPDGSTIYFPAGYYLLGDLEVGVFLAEEGWKPRRNGLTFCGDGHRSILRRRRDAATKRIMTFRGCWNITSCRLGFDANGIDGPDGPPERGGGADMFRGGIAFHSTHQVRITETLSWDSAFVDPADYLDRRGRAFADDDPLVRDRQAFYLSRCRDVWITQNHLQQQQITVVEGRRVLIANNHLVDPVLTGIRLLASRQQDSITEDVSILDNIIRSPRRHGITVTLTDGSTFARVRIQGNTIRKVGGTLPDDDRRVGSGIRLASDTEAPIAGRFEDIVIADNSIVFSQIQDGGKAGIHLFSGDGSDPLVRTVLRDNVVAGLTRGTIRAQNAGISNTCALVEATVAGNCIYGSCESGFNFESFHGDTIRFMHFFGNRVRLSGDGVAYLVSWIPVPGGTWNVVADNAALGPDGRGLAGANPYHFANNDTDVVCLYALPDG